MSIEIVIEYSVARVRTQNDLKKPFVKRIKRSNRPLFMK